MENIKLSSASIFEISVNVVQHKITEIKHILWHISSFHSFSQSDDINLILKIIKVYLSLTGKQISGNKICHK